MHLMLNKLKFIHNQLKLNIMFFFSPLRFCHLWTQWHGITWHHQYKMHDSSKPKRHMYIEIYAKFMRIKWSERFIRISNGKFISVYLSSNLNEQERLCWQLAAVSVPHHYWLQWALSSGYSEHWDDTKLTILIHIDDWDVKHFAGNENNFQRFYWSKHLPYSQQ